MLFKGIEALRALGAILCEAAWACNVPIQRQAKLNWFGIYLKELNSWLGVFLDQPETLVFATSAGLDEAAAHRLGFWEVEGSEDGIPRSWRREINLASDDVHFFKRSAVKQLRFVEGFLRDSMEVVRRIEVADPKSPARQHEIVSACPNLRGVETCNTIT